MRISKEHKLVFVSTPKSGSHTGFKLMEDYFNGKPHGGYHNTHIPSFAKNYYSFTFIRNPYERFCALYHACVVNDRKDFVPEKARKSHLAYAKWLGNLSKSHNYPRKDLCAPQWYWLKDCKLTNYIQIEEAEEEIKELPGYTDKVVLPHELKRTHPVWKDVVTDELQWWVEYWAGLDFYRFGYRL